MAGSPLPRAAGWTAPTLPVTAWPPPGSAANVKKWEIELQTLRESNARLTTALQDSAASVEQWKRQFSLCRDENDRLRNKVGRARVAVTFLSPLPPTWPSVPCPRGRRKTRCFSLCPPLRLPACLSGNATTYRTD